MGAMAYLPGDVGDGAAQPGELLARRLEVLVDAGADLDLRAEELGRNLLAQRLLALLHQLCRRRREPPRFKVDEVVFLLDAEGEGWLLGAHGAGGGSARWRMQHSGPRSLVMPSGVAYMLRQMA